MICNCGKREANYLKKNKRHLCDPCAQEAGYLVPCQGEAHSNPFIDNCGVCMPRWGWVEVKKEESKETRELREFLDDVSVKGRR